MGTRIDEPKTTESTPARSPGGGEPRGIRPSAALLSLAVILAALPALTSQAHADPPQAKLTADDAAANDWFGCAVAVSGDTAIVGAYGDDDGGDESGSAYVFIDSGGVWTQQARLTAPDAASRDRFGYSVAVSGDTAVVGAPTNNEAGAAYVFVGSGGAWTLQTKLTASEGAADDAFGHSVAILGDTILVGALGDDDGAVNAGSMYVFVRDGGSSWTQQAELTASDARMTDGFGASVALSGDTALVGAYLDDDVQNDSGSAYVFTRSGGTSWTQQAKLTASDAAGHDRFGYSVAVSGDTAVIGAYQDFDGGPYAGSAYVFTRSGDAWTQQARLAAPDPWTYDWFGWSVAISGDRLIVGSKGDDDVERGSGSAYVFARSGGGWPLQAKLTAADPGFGDEAGYAVALSGDTALVGAPRDDDGGEDSGSAYAFDLGGLPTPSPMPTSTATPSPTSTATPSPTSTPIPGFKLTADDAAEGDWFGHAVAIDAGAILVGAERDDNYAGAAYLFTRSGGTSWTQQAKLTADDAAAFLGFGVSVALSGDTALVGASPSDNWTGAAYVFARDAGASWTQQARLTAHDAVEGDNFGTVAVSGDTAVIGAPGQDDGGTDAGAAYVFTRTSGTAWTQQAKLTDNDAEEDQYFGHSVAVSGDTAVVGAPWTLGWESGELGRACVFTRSDGTSWTQQATLIGDDTMSKDLFGWSVAIAGDTAVIGARAHDVVGAGLGAGAAYVFTRTGGVWTQQAKLTASDAEQEDSFGASVAISGDTVVVGAHGDDDGGSYSGSAYVFTRSNGTSWTQQAKLTAFDAALEDEFGWSIALCGNTAVVSSHNDDDAGDGSGSAYVFTLWTDAPDIIGYLLGRVELSEPQRPAADANGDGVVDIADFVVGAAGQLNGL